MFYVVAVHDCSLVRRYCLYLYASQWEVDVAYSVCAVRKSESTI